MRYLAMLLCLTSCAVTNPMRDGLSSEDQTPSTSPALSLAQPNTANEEVKQNKAGCPAGVMYDFCTAERHRVEGIFFETNSAVLRLPESASALNELLRSLLAQPESLAVIELHTDAQGADSYNLVMSQKRAEALVDYLVKLGVPEGQLEAKGYGENKPINAGKTAEERAQNRRVELALRPKP